MAFNLVVGNLTAQIHAVLFIRHFGEFDSRRFRLILAGYFAAMPVEWFWSCQSSIEVNLLKAYFSSIERIIDVV